MITPECDTTPAIDQQKLVAVQRFATATTAATDDDHAECHPICRPSGIGRRCNRNFISDNMSKSSVLILFVLCLQLAHVNGALSLINKNNVNNSTLLFDELDENVDISVSDNSILGQTPSVHRGRPQPVYLNEFAVYIPGGPGVADDIAHKYGFTNLGQVIAWRCTLYIT
jgi:hypothetical protein